MELSHGTFSRVFNMGSNKMMVSHFQFADDTIIFCKAVEDQILNIKKILHCFQVMSGLNINFQKSNLFGINIAQQNLVEWVDKIYCKTESFPSTYLGLPFGARVSSVKMWKSVVAKFEKRLAGWKSNLLSIGGRVYFMSLFQILSSIKNELDRIQKRFLWRGSSTARKVHWVDWESVYNFKENGGLGIVDLNIKNRTLLNK